ncbi:MAG TPA: nuclear transport factor 2 family protein [Blastocatellia bacterium]|nr:nuclear transport factor 2 family protein [Blastocatellia bacterium]
MSSLPRNDAEVIAQLIQRINDAWMNGRSAELTEYFHDNIVIVPPDFQGRVQGKAACIASYEEFSRQAVVLEYKQSEPTVDVWGTTAVAAYSWEMAYELNGTTSRESGWDVFVLTREDDTWRAVWRTLMSSPQQSEDSQ